MIGQEEEHKVHGQPHQRVSIRDLTTRMESIRVREMEETQGILQATPFRFAVSGIIVEKKGEGNKTRFRLGNPPPSMNWNPPSG